jgi:flagella basal body P-ring formation protein FlgA
MEAGMVLSPRQLAPPIAVTKGSQVQIRAGSGPVSIAVAGTALGNGMPGEQISVRNAQSQRTIKAWVVSTGLVSTAPPRP